MKKQCILAGVFLLTAMVHVHAQTWITTPVKLVNPAKPVNPAKQHWAPDSGFWQLLIPAGHRKATVVQFYSPDSRLLHEDHLSVGLNPNSRKTRKLLYQELQKYLQGNLTHRGAVMARR